MLKNTELRKKSTFLKFIFPQLTRMSEYFQISIKQLLQTDKLNFKNCAKMYVNNLRNIEWDNEDKFVHFRNIKPTSDTTHFYNYCKISTSRKDTTLIGQLRSNNDFLNHSIKCKNINRKLCAKCGVIETVEHYLKVCKIYTSERNN